MGTVKILGGLVVALAPVLSGCVVVTNGGSFGCRGSVVWVEADPEQIAFDASGMQAVDVRTHNGAISYSGGSETSTDAYVVVRKRAGGATSEDARQALEAIGVYVDRRNDGTQRIGWAWVGQKKPRWNAQVSFDIHAPGNVSLDAETHNGRIEVAGVEGEVRVETHNGGVTVDSRRGPLFAETHNGAIRASYAGELVTLKTHNGRVEADLAGCQAVRGDITTHNGRIHVTVGAQTSAMIDASTHNGGIHCQVPLEESEIKRRRLRGRIGSGEGSLTIVTHNGQVQILNPTG
jgi:hypothetical protein